MLSTHNMTLSCLCSPTLQEDKRQLRETSVHPPSTERYIHTFRDLTNFSGTINVTYRYLAGTPLNRKSKLKASINEDLVQVSCL